MRSLAPALALLVGALGTIATGSAAALERADELRTLRAAAARGQNPAVLALLDKAEGELGAGRPEQAAALLEQALRIEPRNPTAWHFLGLANLELGNSAQAEAMAAKSRSLVAGDEGTRDWASRTLVEPARSFVDRGPAERGATTQQRRWPPVEAAAQAWRDVRSFTWRDRTDGAERVRREQEARRAQQSLRAEQARRAEQTRRAEQRQREEARRAEIERRNRGDGSNDGPNDRGRRGTWL